MRKVFILGLVIFFSAGIFSHTMAETFDTDNTIKIDRIEDPPELKKVAKPYSLFLKAGYQYDDNVRLEPLDVDFFADDSDYLFEGFFYGRYNFINSEDATMGVGYSHYQTLYQDLEEFDITGSIGRLYGRYRLRPFAFGVSYLPAYFWVNSESYLLRHQVRPEVIWKISDDFSAKLTYSYFNDDFRRDIDDDRDGDIHEVYLNLAYLLFQRSVYLSGSIGYTDKSADADEEAYDQMTAKAGFYATLPWTLRFSVTGKYYQRTYGEDSAGFEREDDKYIGSASLSSNLYYDWLSIIAEYEYTKNESDVETYDYERNIAGLSLAVKF